MGESTGDREGPELIGFLFLLHARCPLTFRNEVFIRKHRGGRLLRNVGDIFQLAEKAVAVPLAGRCSGSGTLLPEYQLSSECRLSRGTWTLDYIRKSFFFTFFFSLSMISVANELM